MILKNCCISDFVSRCTGKKIFCFGAYVMPIGMCNENPELEIEKKVMYMVDNDVNKQGKMFDLCGYTKKILSAEQLAQIADNNSVIIITSGYFVSIIEQLNTYRSLDNVECYVYPIMKSTFLKYEKINPRTCSEKLIPKVIHYFWFGGNEKNALINMCLESWRKFCPDYEIKEWNESNYDVSKNRFALEAYNEKKWGFVSDYARMDILYQYGGIYMDTDVEVIKPLDDLLYNNAYFGFGNYGRINSGLGFGCTAGNSTIKALLDIYNGLSFYEMKSNADLITNTIRETSVFEQYGLVQNNTFQIINNTAVYPSDFFAPNIPGTSIINTTDNTYSIHHNNFSWASDEQLKQYKKSISETSKIIFEMNKNLQFET